MKEKRRITKDGYFEVSKDGGKTYVKTTQRPSAKEVAEWKAMQVTTPESTKTTVTATPTTKKGGIAEKVNPRYGMMQEERMQPRSVALPSMPSPSNNESLEPKQSTSIGKVAEIGADAKRKLQESNAKKTSNYSAALETGLAGLQAGYGLQQLLKDKRPVGEIDPAYSALTDEAIAASKYGYSPTQRALLEQDIIRTRQAQQARINQLAGGNAAVGLTSARAALNEEVRNRMELAAKDEQMRMQKVQAALQPAGVRAQMGRQLFQDKMNEFMQKQQAGAELLGAGIQNLVGAQRYKQERMAQDQINKMMYGNTNLG
ncbi:MAG: hypothetical protein RIR01_1906 [Bacteroidota bacterium]|jgi:hypothetical protein